MTLTGPCEFRNTSDDSRGVSPVIGVVIMVAIVVILAAVVASFVLQDRSEDPAPHAEFETEVDVKDDAIKLRKTTGDQVFGDETRLVLVIDGKRYQVGPTASHTKLKAGQSFTVYFDGSTSSTGRWAGLASPGAVDISAKDEVTVELYDQPSNKPIVEESFTARERRENIVSGSGGGSGGSGGGSGDLFFVDDQTAGKSGVTFEIQFTIQSGSNTISNSLNSVEIVMDDSSLTIFSGTSQSDVIKAGVDKDGDGTIDTNVQSDMDAWNVKSGGSHLKIGFGGAAYTNVKAGHTIIVVFDGVTNPPSAGTYDGKIQTSGDGNWQHDEISIK